MSTALIDTKNTEVTKTRKKTGHPGRRNVIPLEVLIDMHVKQKMGVSEIAKVLNVSHVTVSNRLNKEGINLLSIFKENKKNILLLEQKKLLESISEEQRKKASYRDKMVSLGILEDKISGRHGDVNINLQVNLIEQIYDSRFKPRPQDVVKDAVIENVANQATTEVIDITEEK